MRKYIKIITGILILIMIVNIIMLYLQKGREMEVYNSYTSKYSDYQYNSINVVVNQLYISDKQSCAEEIVRKCRENSFTNMLFNYDLSIPNGLKVTVYLSKRHVKQYRPSFTFTYTQTSSEQADKYNIIDHPEHFHISFIS